MSRHKATVQLAQLAGDLRNAVRPGGGCHPVAAAQRSAAIIRISVAGALICP